MANGITRVCIAGLVLCVYGCNGGSGTDATAGSAQSAAAGSRALQTTAPARSSLLARAAAAGNSDPLILPGFQPLSTDGAGIHLGVGRRYDWGGQLLPAAIESRGLAIAGSMQLVVRSDGAEVPIVVTGNQVIHSGGDKVEIRATGTAAGALQIETRTVVEYDGMGVVDVVLVPKQPVAIDQIDFRVSVMRSPEQQVLGFSSANIYWPGREKFLEPCYRGAYKSVIGFVGRQSSFWWLADQSDGWAAAAQPSTEIQCTQTELQLKQPIVIGARLLTAPVHYRFAFLATPVRDLTPEFRSNRIVANLSADEARVGNINLYWTNATAHFALPYLDYPRGALQRLSAADIKAYPGATLNAEHVQHWRGRGIERLPYISLRAISPLDPDAQVNLPQWKAEPLRTTGLEVDGPYTIAFVRPLVSLRADSFVDYQLERLADIADRLDVRGFYFDQAGPIGSTNAAHVSPDPAGSVRSATDVLAMRGFFRRLATMLHAKGQPGLIYVHNSAAPVIPAYTFVTGMVQGEELNTVAAISNFDYQGSVPLSYIWPLYSPQSSGVPTVWLEELWSEVFAEQRPPEYRTDVRGWIDSEGYHRAWRNFMSLALLHDIPVWTNAPVSRREALYGQLDGFGVGESTFMGYWESQSAGPDQPVLISAYLRPDVPAMLVIAANLTASPQTISPDAIGNRFAAANLPAALRDVVAQYATTGTPSVIPPHDFALIDIR